MKKPKREPDYIGIEDNWKYYFKEMIVYTDPSNEICKIKYEYDYWVWSWNDSKKWITDANTVELKIAYKKWVFDIEFNKLLGEE